MLIGTRGRAGAAALGPASLAALMLAWLWPIGLGGRMPVGGDVTQFQIGLMAVLGEALRDGRLPLWNDRWGFGFPGLAESQMGVSYPPHLVLYRLLSVEAAYTASMLLHVVWGALGARWAARRFGASEAGAILSGGAWAASGFFLIHLPHQWAYTVGSWTPWAWGLAWSILSGEGTRRTPWLLAAVLAVQLLPGHFQLAFATQVSLLVMGLAAVVTGRGPRRPIARRAAIPMLCLIGAVLMASCQLVPTLRLARLAEAQRDYEYLSGFALTPLHLVNLVAPDLFHRSPLWRPVAWDPFHTSPEEVRLYVGLIPAFLALLAIARPGEHRLAVRVLAIVLAAGLVLALGPYVPGFRQYSQWPGFSFFRAPARWGIVASLALAILAGLGFDAIRGGRIARPGRWLAVFVVGASAWIAGMIGLFELALRSTEGAGSAGVPAPLDRAFGLLPWRGDPPLAEVLARARRPQADLRVVAAQAREGLGPVPAGGLRLDRERGAIYRAELATTAALLLAALAIAPTARRRGVFLAALALMTVADLGLLARRRPVETAPIRPLARQSAVLERLAAMPEGTRTIDPMRNLPMVAGAAPVQSYRTLDLPIQPALRAIADLLPRDPRQAESILDAQRSLGARVRVVGPIGPGIEALRDRFAATGRLASSQIVDDPALTSWLLGAGYAESPEGRAGRYLLLDAGAAPRAWFLPIADPDRIDRLRDAPGDPALVTALLADARPLVLRATTPERPELDLEADSPGLVLLTQLDDPQWTASLAAGDSPAHAVPVLRVLGGWQGVAVPGPGRWTLRLSYDGRSERLGLLLSSASWLAWCLGLVLALRRPPPGPRSPAPAP